MSRAACLPAAIPIGKIHVRAEVFMQQSAARYLLVNRRRFRLGREANSLQVDGCKLDSIRLIATIVE
jgi:hypothetical protein